MICLPARSILCVRCSLGRTFLDAKQCSCCRASRAGAGLVYLCWKYSAWEQPHAAVCGVAFCYRPCYLSNLCQLQVTHTPEMITDVASQACCKRQGGFCLSLPMLLKLASLLYIQKANNLGTGLRGNSRCEWGGCSKGVKGLGAGFQGWRLYPEMNLEAVLPWSSSTTHQRLFEVWVSLPLSLPLQFQSREALPCLVASRPLSPQL